MVQVCRSRVWGSGLGLSAEQVIDHGSVGMHGIFCKLGCLTWMGPGVE